MTEKKVFHNEEEMRNILLSKGFSDAEILAIISLSNVFSVENLRLVPNQELAGLGFEPQQVNRLRQVLGPKNIKRVRSQTP